MSKKTTLTRYEVENLFLALSSWSRTNANSLHRYFIARNLSSLDAEVKATGQAFPRPQLQGAPEEPANVEAIESFEKARESHMLERVDVELFPLELIPELDAEDLRKVLPAGTPDWRVHSFHQELIRGLMPILPP